MTDTPTAQPTTVPHTPHRGEWALTACAGVMLILLGIRMLRPGFLAGELLPCMTLALLPGALIRLTTRKSSWSAFRLGIAAGLIAFMLTNGVIDLSPLRDMHTAWPLLLGALGLIALQPLLGAVRWKLLLEAQGCSFTYGRVLRLVLVGTFFNTFVPGATGGDIYRAYCIARHQGKNTEAICSVVMDRLLGLPALLLLVTFAAILNHTLLLNTPAFHPYAWTLLFVTALSAIVFGLIWWGGWRAHKAEDDLWLTRLPGGRALHKSLCVIGAYRHHGRTLVLAILVSLAAHASVVGACTLVATATGMEEVSLQQHALLVPMGLTVNAVPVSPGGVGQGEGAFFVLYKAAAPHLNNGPRAALVMLVLRAGLALCGLAGGILYAFGKHALPRPEELETDDPLAPAGDPA